VSSHGIENSSHLFHLNVWCITAKSLRPPKRFVLNAEGVRSLTPKRSFLTPNRLFFNAEGVDPNVLWTIAYNETRFRPWLTSPKNAKGMMQFIPATAVRFDLSDPYNRFRRFAPPQNT
jgi:hypothetical protein